MTDHTDLLRRLRHWADNFDRTWVKDCLEAADAIEALQKQIANIFHGNCQATLRAEQLEADNAALRKISVAASHALRSYQYGNSSTELAESTADAIDAAMREGKSP